METIHQLLNYFHSYNIKYILLASIIIVSCEKINDEFSSNDNGKLEFGINIKSDLLKCTEPDQVNSVDAVLISLKDASGRDVYLLERFELLKFGEEFVTEPIALKTGDYTLTDFVVVNKENTVLFATPKEGSGLEGSVTDALPIFFSIQNNQVVKLIPEVIWVGTAVPGDFGYSSFSFEIIETFDLLISTLSYNLDSRNYELVESKIKILDKDKTVYSGELTKGTNVIRVKENIDEYNIVIEKQYYKPFSTTFSNAALKCYTKKPLVITLEPYNLELVAKIAPYSGIVPQWIEAVIIPSKKSDNMVVATQVIGADCGGGSPVAVWGIALDPISGLGKEVGFKQSLNEVQNIRQTFFESSDDLLFTGSGWCGYKPPYFSDDYGETWKRADAGPVHPPNSTFCYTEFKNNVYAGTGYSPYTGQVYRWLGNGNWELKLNVTHPARTIVSSLVVFDNKMFASANIYSAVKKGGIPVYVTMDGNSYSATSGISDDMGVYKLFTDDNHLYAMAYRNNYYLYKWNGNTWEGPTQLEFSMVSPMLILAYDNNIYISGKKDGDSGYGIYVSRDYGISWEVIVPHQSPVINYMTVINSAIYFGTKQDAENSVHIYRLEL